MNYILQFFTEKNPSTQPTTIFPKHHQMEGICFFDDGRCFVTAETSPTMTSRVFVADFRKWIEKELKNKKQ